MPERKYDELAAQIRRDILAGHFNLRMPGGQVLSQKYGANFKTVNRAMDCLEKEKLLRTVRGEGRLIVPHQQAAIPKTVVLLVQTEGHVYSNLAMELVRRLQLAGWHALVVDSRFFQSTPEEVRRILAYHSVGLVVEGYSEKAREFFTAHKEQFPRNIIWSWHSNSRDPDAVTIYADCGKGIELATRHLIEQGHRRILFVQHRWLYGAENHPGSAHEQLMRAYERALGAAGLEDRKRYLFVGQDTTAENLREIRRIFEEPASTRPTGVVTFTDHWAFKLTGEVRQLGLRIPADVAVVGFNNTPWTAYAEAPLSSVSIEEHEIARLIVEKLTGDYRPGERIAVAPRLIVRASSAPNGAPRVDSPDPSSLLEERR